MSAASIGDLSVASMTGDGSDTTLTLPSTVGTVNNTLLFIGGIYQPKSTYSILGTTLTFSTAPPSGTTVEAVIGSATNVNLPSDGTVTSAKLVGDLTTPNKLTIGGSLTLGGNLDVTGHDIVTTSNGNIELDPNGSGKVVFKGNATKGAGQFVLNLSLIHI